MRIFFQLIVIFFWSLFFLSGCTLKRPAPPRSAVIVFKTPTLRYADMGFIQKAREKVLLQIYNSGQPVFNLTVGPRICIEGRCLDEREFYTRYFHASYPEGTLAAILEGRPVFDGANLDCDDTVCRQRIRKPGRLDIIYDFNATHVRFKDRRNGVLIKIDTP